MSSNTHGVSFPRSLISDSARPNSPPDSTSTRILITPVISRRYIVPPLNGLGFARATRSHWFVFGKSNRLIQKDVKRNAHNRITPVVYVIHKSLTVCQTSNLTPTRQRVAILTYIQISSHRVLREAARLVMSPTRPASFHHAAVPSCDRYPTSNHPIPPYHKSLQPTCNSTCELC